MVPNVSEITGPRPPDGNDIWKPIPTAWLINEPSSSHGQSQAAHIVACDLRDTVAAKPLYGATAGLLLCANHAGNDNLSELVCSRASITSIAAAVQALVEERQPMFNVDLRGYDHREVPVANVQDWKACKAACDGGGQCEAWTLVPEHKICFLKWDNNTELLSANSCCIVGIKGMASAGAGAKQSTVKAPDKLKLLGSRTQQAVEDELGRKVEDAVRRGIDKILRRGQIRSNDVDA